MAQPLYLIHRHGRHRIAQRERWARRERRRRPAGMRSLADMARALVPIAAGIALFQRFRHLMPGI